MPRRPALSHHLVLASTPSPKKTVSLVMNRTLSTVQRFPPPFLLHPIQPHPHSPACPHTQTVHMHSPVVMSRQVSSSSSSLAMMMQVPQGSLPRRPARPLIWMYSPLVTHLCER